MSWVPATKPEIMALGGGLQIANGVADLPEIRDYWSTEPTLEIPWYKSPGQMLNMISYTNCALS